MKPIIIAVSNLPLQMKFNPFWHSRYYRHVTLISPTPSHIAGPIQNHNPKLPNPVVWGHPSVDYTCSYCCYVLILRTSLFLILSMTITHPLFPLAPTTNIGKCVLRMCAAEECFGSQSDPINPQPTRNDPLLPYQEGRMSYDQLDWIGSYLTRLTRPLLLRGSSIYLAAYRFALSFIF